MPSENEIYAGLTDVFREIIGNDHLRLSPELTAKDVPGWDSVAMVSIIVAVEQHFGVKLRSREIDQLKNVGDLASLVGRKLG